MFGAMPGNGLAELVEAARRREQRLDQEEAPAVADAVERGGERSRRRRGGGVGIGLARASGPW